MATEIERKFLVDATQRPDLSRADGQSIEQGYLSFHPSVRVRRGTSANSAPRAWLTVKGPGVISRAEYEYEIPEHDARELLGLCLARLTKVRYRIAHAGHTWELDEFTGAHAGLYLAEIELDDANATFDRPAWVAREVTDDARYTNSALARAGRAP